MEGQGPGDHNGACVIRGQGPGFDTIRDGKRICEGIYSSPVFVNPLKQECNMVNSLPKLMEWLADNKAACLQCCVKPKLSAV